MFLHNNMSKLLEFLQDRSGSQSSKRACLISCIIIYLICISFGYFGFINVGDFHIKILNRYNV